MTKKTKLTPLMQQYFAIKQEHPESLLFFQVGDFYELFFEDAVTAAGFLAITLTKRGKKDGQDIPLCGIPVHALNHYLVKLIKGGFKVAICDQTSKPEPGKVVERAVSRVLTPGTLTESSMLDATSASYLFTLYPGQDTWALLFTELLTAQMFATCVPAGDYRMLEAELIRFLPDEVVLPSLSIQPAELATRDERGNTSQTKKDPLTPSDSRSELYRGADNTPTNPKLKALQTYLKQNGYVISHAQQDAAGTPVARAWIDAQFNHLRDRIQASPEVASSLLTLHSYLDKNQQQTLTQFKHIQFYDPQDYLVLDGATQRNLELVKNSHDGGRKNTLLSILDKACTPMGSRTIKKWVLRPLVQKSSIIQRQQVIAALKDNLTLFQQLEEQLKQCADLERIIGRMGLGRALQQDYLALLSSLTLLPTIKKILQPLTELTLIKIMMSKLIDFEALIDLLNASLAEDINGPYLIKKGFDKKLDELRDLFENGQHAILAFEKREVERTGISSLKVGYNQVSGYYLEVTNPNLAKVPDDYVQYQKLANRQRFVTPELKELEHNLHKAQTQTTAVEKSVYERVKNEVNEYLAPLRSVAQTLAYLDALFGFARVAYNNAYVMPTFNDAQAITIDKGRHPVVEYNLNESFIANSTNLTPDEYLWIITGPNMGGKSTYLRQVALISIMAQCGSFVPASAASLPVLDRVFTRIGAGDDVAQGKSTFLVEMEETAVICSQATKNSLVILDEVGRGTSTYDGMAIAQAIIEYLYTTVGARCLFATHYHELTKLADQHSGIANYYLKSQPSNEGIIFLHELGQGVAQGSFGLEVAKLAHLPDAVVKRAGEILQCFDQPTPGLRPASKLQPTQGLRRARSMNEEKSGVNEKKSLTKKIAHLQNQLKEKEQQLAALDNLDLDDITPRKALEVLFKIKG